MPPSLSSCTEPSTPPPSNTALSVTVTGPSQPSPSQKPFSKPRLLWKSSLILQDGTVLPGVAFASYIDPFHPTGSEKPHQSDHLSSSLQPPKSHLLGGPTQSSHDRSFEVQKEAEASLCLALEMVRHRPLQITSILSDSGSKPSELEKTKSSQLALAHSFSKTSNGSLQKSVHWVSSGAIRVFIDPNEPSTFAFFHRHFCLKNDTVPESLSIRSAKIVTVSVQGVTTAAPQSADDMFATRIGSSTGEFAIFGQLDSTDQNRPPLLRLVVGRKVIATTRKPLLRELSANRSLQRHQSNGSQTLNDLFSQAGLSLPQFGIEASYVDMPDDPLARGSIAALLQARAQSRTRSKAMATISTLEPCASSLVAGSDSRLSSPAAESGIPSQRSAFQSRRSSSQFKQPDAGFERREIVQSRSLARRAGNASASHTPGRRGEKRPRQLDSRSPSSSPDKAGQTVTLSPNKRKKIYADRVKIQVTPLLLPNRETILAEIQTQTPRPGTIGIKIEAKTPDTLFLNDESWSDNTAKIELSNRSMIKKQVHTILVNERGLAKTDEDYTVCYTQACSGTYCAFRKVAKRVKLEKEAVEKVVRLHLQMYLDGVE